MIITLSLTFSPIKLRAGVLGPIYASIEDSVQDIDLLRQCSAMVGNMAENGENQVAMVKDSLLPRLNALGALDHPDVQLDVARTFASLTSNSENLVNVFAAKEIETMLRLTASTEENCRRDSLVAIGEFVYLYLY